MEELKVGSRVTVVKVPASALLPDLKEYIGSEGEIVEQFPWNRFLVQVKERRIVLKECCLSPLKDSIVDVTGDNEGVWPEEESDATEKKPLKVYISIPITGYDIFKVKERAERVKNDLLKQYKEVVTPFDVCPEEGKEYSYYMGRDIEEIIKCDAVFFCEGAESSVGCQIEYFTAIKTGKRILYDLNRLTNTLLL